jgi:hypothetical protein
MGKISKVLVQGLMIRKRETAEERDREQEAAEERHREHRKQVWDAMKDPGPKLGRRSNSKRRPPSEAAGGTRGPKFAPPHRRSLRSPHP